jgi:hypothetical protein
MNGARSYKGQLLVLQKARKQELDQIMKQMIRQNRIPQELFVSWNYRGHDSCYAMAVEGPKHRSRVVAITKAG